MVIIGLLIIVVIVLLYRRMSFADNLNVTFSDPIVKAVQQALAQQQQVAQQQVAQQQVNTVVPRPSVNPTMKANDPLGIFKTPVCPADKPTLIGGLCYGSCPEGTLQAGILCNKLTKVEEADKKDKQTVGSPSPSQKMFLSDDMVQDIRKDIIKEAVEQSKNEVCKWIKKCKP